LTVELSPDVYCFTFLSLLKQKHIANFIDIESGELFPNNEDKIIKEDLDWRELELLNDISSQESDYHSDESEGEAKSQGSLAISDDSSS
jgi:hypothetical protein